MHKGITSETPTQFSRELIKKIERLSAKLKTAINSISEWSEDGPVSMSLRATIIKDVLILQSDILRYSEMLGLDLGDFFTESDRAEAKGEELHIYQTIRSLLEK